ncbi:hypothetical protein Gotri_027467, partial [Gossypium trilobum]|nr:hypothetical protein [Gossypium trilobum]
MRTTGLGKTSEQWHQEIQEENFLEAQMRNETLE